jgi:hypothetical protein
VYESSVDATSASPSEPINFGISVPLFVGSSILASPSDNIKGLGSLFRVNPGGVTESNTLSHPATTRPQAPNTSDTLRTGGAE